MWHIFDIYLITSEKTNTHEVIAQAMAETMRARSQNTGPWLGRPVMKHPNFNWEAEDKYNKLKNFRLEVNNFFQILQHPTNRKASNYKNWLGRKGLKGIASLTQMEQERCNTTGLFTTFKIKFNPQFNETIRSLQFHKLSRQTKENAEEWMDRLRLTVVECNYREVDR